MSNAALAIDERADSRPTFDGGQVREHLQRLPKAIGEFSPRVLDWGTPDAISLSQLRQVDLSIWFERAVINVKGPDAKLAGAYLAGGVGWSLSEVLGGLALEGLFLADLDEDAIALRPRMIEWEHDGKTGTRYTVDVGINTKRVRFCPDDTQMLGALETVFNPVVEAIHSGSSLPRAALWRLMGDSVSAAMLSLGKQSGRAGYAMDLANALLHVKGSPLYSRQVGFCEVSLPERPEVSEWFRKRGGCCRYYTSDGGEYCTTCVLRDDESRTERLQTYLRETHAA